MSTNLIRLINDINGTHIADLRCSVVPRTSELIDLEDHVYEVRSVKHYMHARKDVPKECLHSARTTLRVKKV